MVHYSYKVKKSEEKMSYKILLRKIWKEQFTGAGFISNILIFIILFSYNIIVFNITYFEAGINAFVGLVASVYLYYVLKKHNILKKE